MKNIRNLLEELKRVEELDAQLDELLCDFSEEGQEKFDAVCELRDALVDTMVAEIKLVGIEEKIARTMVLNKQYQGKLIDLFSRVAF